MVAVITCLLLLRLVIDCLLFQMLELCRPTDRGRILLFHTTQSQRVLWYPIYIFLNSLTAKASAPVYHTRLSLHFSIPIFSSLNYLVLVSTVTVIEVVGCCGCSCCSCCLHLILCCCYCCCCSCCGGGGGGGGGSGVVVVVVVVHSFVTWICIAPI